MSRFRTTRSTLQDIPRYDMAESNDRVRLPPAWSGRFSEPVSDGGFTSSVEFIAASPKQTSPARSLTLECFARSAFWAARIGRDRTRDAGDPRRDRPWRIPWSRDLEDVHFNIEKRLTALVGDAGKRLHTGRSRNDQVATDLRLWLRGEIDALTAALASLRQGFIALADRHAGTIMPGYTHLQVAQPVTFGHHLLAYEAMFARDAERLRDCRRRVNRLPLGSAALAGRRSRSIGRGSRASSASALCENSLDAVSDRDFAVSSPPPLADDDARLTLREELAWWMNPALRSFRSPIASAPDRRSCRRRRIPMSSSSRAARPGASPATWSRC
jgi:argininosuccinate lyase